MKRSLALLAGTVFSVGTWLVACSDDPGSKKARDTREDGGLGGSAGAGGSAGGGGSAGAGGAAPLQCDSGKADCDGDAANGCEVTLASDNHHCGACGRDCGSLGTTCTQGACGLAEVYTAQPYGSDNQQNLTWAFDDSTLAHTHGSYTVTLYPMNGSGVKELWKTPTFRTKGTGALVLTSTDVYWAERGTPSLVLKKARSAAPDDLPTVVFQPTYQPQFLRLVGDTFYWASGDYQSGDPGGYIYSRPSSGGAEQQLVSQNQGTHGAIYGLEVTTDAIYWVTRDNNAYALRTVPLSGGTPVTVDGPLLDYASMARIAMVAVGDTLYYNRYAASGQLNGVYRYKAGDAAPQQLVSMDGVTTMIVDGAYLYFTSSYLGGVFRVPLSGGGSQRIAAGSASVRLVGADATHLYLSASTCCATTLYKALK